MKKVFNGWLFNRVEDLGGKTFNHVGCKGDNEQFDDFLIQFVPEIGTQRKVTFTIESEKDIEEIEEYKFPKEYVKEKKDV